MYSELLSDLWLSSDADREPPSKEELVADLQQCRLRLHRRASVFWVLRKRSKMSFESVASMRDCPWLTRRMSPMRSLPPISLRT